ncbi:HAMP domain-containing sensor histidine kinase [Sphaerisporangium sp. TRM90804]|uniref:HAMP domain-containing sensor histidine kinase n=1 Tax=Sphaerisporangium sp. TRM90804 TaxID=3031113 RepID=UPI002447CE73|nr:HAMP domain-containing sensor histidine kinase [Sphaerisporangium sp. TRM90804]MDH2429592.1 HAMP domain-containing sensor histidine kinase [Sphaerisporangium sp. TRM90804]
MRRRLLVLVASTVSLALVAFLVPLALLARELAADRATADALVRAQSLVPVVSVAGTEALQLAVEQADGEDRPPLTVYLPGGAVLGAPASPSDAVRLAFTGRSLTAQAAGGREIVVAVEGRPGGTAVVRTFVSQAELTRGVGRAWLILGLLGLGLLIISLVVADRLARSLIRPIAGLAGLSHRLAAGDLTARASPEGPPEIRDVTSALNNLAERIRVLLAQEREAVADLSHQLRTPLTVLRVEVDGLPASEQSARVGTAVEGVERMVTKVIEEARRSRQEATGECDAAEVVAERLDHWSMLARDQGRAVERDLASAPLRVGLAQETLVTCVDALLENVFAHTPEGTALAVHLSGRPEGGAVLQVTDRGPGFTHHDPSERGVSGGSSTGLGLDIVRRAARRAGGSLTLGSAPGGGARVTVELGPPPRWPGISDDRGARPAATLTRRQR